MKRIISISLLMVLLSLVKAQLVVHDAPNYGVAREQLHKMQVAVEQLGKQIDWMRLHGQYQHEMYWFQDSVANEQLNTERLQGLQLTEETDLFTLLQVLSVPPSAYGEPGNNVLSTYDPLLSGQDVGSANSLYEFFYPQAPITLDAVEDQDFQLNLVAKRKAVIELIKKQSLHLALVYFKLATTEAQKAEELRDYLLDSEQLSMSEGERLSVLLEVNKGILHISPK